MLALTARIAGAVHPFSKQHVRCEVLHGWLRTATIAHIQHVPCNLLRRRVQVAVSLTLAAGASWLTLSCAYFILFTFSNFFGGLLFGRYFFGLWGIFGKYLGGIRGGKPPPPKQPKPLTKEK